jgi:hypothetical protein
MRPSILTAPVNVRSLALFVAITLPISAAAGIRAEFNTTLTSPAYSYSGVLAIEGNASRIDVLKGSHPLFRENTSIITRDGGQEIVILDHERRTWHARRAAGLGGHLSTSRGLGATTASDPQVQTTRNGREYRLHVKYGLVMAIEGEKLTGNVDLEVISEVDPDLHQKALPWGLQYAAKSGFDEVDRVIARGIPRGMPVRQVVTATRQIEGGEPLTETMTTVLTNLASAPTPKEVFFPPKDYRYEVPKFEFGTQ